MSIPSPAHAAFHKQRHDLAGLFRARRLKSQSHTLHSELRRALTTTSDPWARNDLKAFALIQTSPRFDDSRNCALWVKLEESRKRVLPSTQHEYSETNPDGQRKEHYTVKPNERRLSQILVQSPTGLHQRPKIWATIADNTSGHVPLELDDQVQTYSLLESVLSTATIPSQSRTVAQVGAVFPWRVEPCGLLRWIKPMGPIGHTSDHAVAGMTILIDTAGLAADEQVTGESSDGQPHTSTFKVLHVCEGETIIIRPGVAYSYIATCDMVMIEGVGWSEQFMQASMASWHKTASRASHPADFLFDEYAVANAFQQWAYSWAPTEVVKVAEEISRILAQRDPVMRSQQKLDSQELGSRDSLLSALTPSGQQPGPPSPKSPAPRPCIPPTGRQLPLRAPRGPLSTPGPETSASPINTPSQLHPQKEVSTTVTTPAQTNSRSQAPDTASDADIIVAQPGTQYSACGATLDRAPTTARPSIAERHNTIREAFMSDKTKKPTAEIERIYKMLDKQDIENGRRIWELVWANINTKALNGNLRWNTCAKCKEGHRQCQPGGCQFWQPPPAFSRCLPPKKVMPKFLTNTAGPPDPKEWEPYCLSEDDPLGAHVISKISRQNTKRKKPSVDGPADNNQPTDAARKRTRTEEPQNHLEREAGA